MQNSRVERRYKRRTFTSPRLLCIHKHAPPIVIAALLSPPNWQLSGAREAIKQWSGQTRCRGGSKGVFIIVPTITCGSSPWETNPNEVERSLKLVVRLNATEGC